MQNLPAGKQFFSVNELHNAGYSKYKISQLVKNGIITSVNRKWYENSNYTGEINDFYAVNPYAEQGVICLISAAVYHELTTHRPSHIDVALPRSARVPQSPEWPSMKFYRLGEDRYTTGIVTIQEGENSFRIYDREKTVCDMILYRNKLGFEPAVEVLKMYIKRPDRDINRLLKYAEMLHVKTSIKQYLEVLL